MAATSIEVVNVTAPAPRSVGQEVMTADVDALVIQH